MSRTDSGSDGWLTYRWTRRRSSIPFDERLRIAARPGRDRRDAEVVHASLAQELIPAQMRRQDAARANQADSYRIGHHHP